MSETIFKDCLFGKEYEIHVKSGGPDCGSERIQKAIDKAQELGADVILEPGKYTLDVPLRLPQEVNISGLENYKDKS